MRPLVILTAAVLAAGVVAAWPSSAPPQKAPAPVAHRRATTAHSSKRPPQFVISSYDGSGGARLWEYWRGVAKRAHAHFTFFVSGVYLVDWAHHDRYAPPRNPRGSS